ncbi:MAG: hypothetical protein WEC84_00755 [Candidatus Andersenbacteria bacterium]
MAEDRLAKAVERVTAAEAGFDALTAGIDRLIQSEQNARALAEQNARALAELQEREDNLSSMLEESANRISEKLQKLQDRLAE